MTGDYKPLFSNNQMLAYFRKIEGSPGFLIVLNLSHGPAYYIPERFQLKGTIVIATSPEMEGMAVEDSVNLSGDEGVIIRLEKEPSEVTSLKKM